MKMVRMVRKGGMDVNEIKNECHGMLETKRNLLKLTLVPMAITDDESLPIALHANMAARSEISDSMMREGEEREEKAETSLYCQRLRFV